ncbi:hypothetical protein RYZ26_07625 [Terasakiella sp. A23]|uniref:hypothetical protein n=1 Tax=Terasakiella sp. FCG-A23 TaxID=3080561 RepID=UPI00295440CB|nr:hypothetical protein [Terasakiella sp. A23]MDV7339456.1 hypothetical protein [Terasakiella sp. A23]
MWVQIIIMVVQMAMAMKQASDQKKAAAKAAQQKADAVAKEQWATYEKQEKQRKDQLKKALAKRRARFGASGLSAADGSAGAIIQGLRTDEAEASHEDFTQRKEHVDSALSSIQSNLLEQSKATNRTLYKQLGQSAGSFGNSMMGGGSGGGSLMQPMN